MGRATEELAARSGPGIGGLLNVTFGNAPELIIALFALEKGLHEVVKASIVGSILGNILLVLGRAMFVGGIGRKEQPFKRQSANAQSSMLFLAVAAMVMPAVFELVRGHGLPGVDAQLVHFGSSIETLSVVVACILIASYISGLYFSLRTHRDVFNPPYEDEDTWGWSTRSSVLMLAIAGVAVGLMSEILVGSIEVGLALDRDQRVLRRRGRDRDRRQRRRALGRGARRRKDKMDLAVNIAIGSGRPGGAVRRAGARPRQPLSRPVHDAAGLQRLRDRGDADRGHHRQRRHQRGRVDLVRGAAAAARLRGAGRQLRVCLDRAPLVTFDGDDQAAGR